MIHSAWARIRTLQQRVREQRGSVLVVVAGSMLALTSVVALAIDVGLMTTARVEAQRAADAAALAGAGAFIASPGNGGLARVLATEYAAANTIRSETVTLLEDDGNRSVIEITIGGFDAKAVDIEGEEYFLINLPREGLQKEVGLPQLPNVRRSLIIPNDREMGLTILDSEYVDLADMPVAPSKGYLPRTVDPASVPYTFADFYAGTDTYPADIAEADEPHILRDYRGMVVDANVFLYPCGISVRFFIGSPRHSGRPACDENEHDTDSAYHAPADPLP